MSSPAYTERELADVIEAQARNKRAFTSWSESLTDSPEHEALGEAYFDAVNDTNDLYRRIDDAVRTRQLRAQR
jgi:hypothetical protein